MKKHLLVSILFVFTLNLFSQSWTKISTNFDSLWTSSVKYFNKGDTIIYYGSTTGTGAANAKRFYVSTDGGITFSRDFTALAAIAYSPIVGLPINNMIIGFKNTPNDGSYSFQGLNNWTSILPQGVGVYGEVNAGTLLYNTGSGSTTLRTMTTSGGSLAVVASGAAGIDLISTYNKGNRLFLGGGTSNMIKYVDNGDFNNIQTSTIAAIGSGSDVVRFFESANLLYAVVDAGTNKLFKSLDNGVTWTQVITTFDDGGTPSNLTSAFTIGTPNGNIFYLETSTGTSDNVYLSTDGGLTATKISQGLPINGMHISPTIGRILTKGNKVWYQVCAANTIDFVRTDTSIAGLYTFNGITGIQQENQVSKAFSIFPNPCSNELQIVNNLNENEPIQIYVTNILGEIMYSAQELNTLYNSMNVENLVPGIYFLNIKQGLEMHEMKFVKE